MTLAIKPTRRELIKTVLDVVRNKKLQEAEAVEKKWRETYQAAQQANTHIQEIARGFANKKYKPLLDKIRKLVHTEFPDAQVNFSIDLAKLQNKSHTRDRFDPDGKAKVWLSVWDAEKTELDLPKEVREEMVAAQNESHRLFAESDKAYEQLQELRCEANEYGRNDNASYQKLLERVVPSLGEEAVPHLDALIAMVEKALEASPATVINDPDAE